MTGDATFNSAAADPVLLNGIGWAVRWQDRQRSSDYARSAIELSAAADGRKARSQVGQAKLTLAWQAKWRGLFDESLTLALDVERLLREADFPDERAHTYSIIGVVHYSRGRFDLAANAVERGLSLSSADRDASAYVDLLTTRASIFRHTGNGLRAGLVLGRAEEICDGEDTARVQHNIARWLLEGNEAEKALERAERAVLLAGQYRCRVIEPYAREVMGAALTELGLCDAAEVCFTEGLQIAGDDEDLRAECQLLRMYGAMEQKRGNTDRALELFQSGCKKATALGYAIWRQRFARETAALYEARGDLKAALEQHRIAWSIADEVRV